MDFSITKSFCWLTALIKVKWVTEKHTAKEMNRLNDEFEMCIRDSGSPSGPICSPRCVPTPLPWYMVSASAQPSRTWRPPDSKIPMRTTNGFKPCSIKGWSACSCTPLWWGRVFFAIFAGIHYFPADWSPYGAFLCPWVFTRISSIWMSLWCAPWALPRRKWLISRKAVHCLSLIHI